MAKKILKANLSTDSIKKLQEDLLKHQNDLNKKCELFARRLAKRGVQIAKANVTRLDAIFTGELINSIHAEKGDSENGTAIFFVVADSIHAAYVEFGTGQLGQEGAYPYPLPEGVHWNYNTGKTIFEVSPGQYGWFYPRGGKWYFTQGMPSRPFMYETSLELQRIVVETAKEVFGK